MEEASAIAHYAETHSRQSRICATSGRWVLVVLVMLLVLVAMIVAVIVVVAVPEPELQVKVQATNAMHFV